MRRIHWTFPAAALCLVGAIVTGCMLLERPSPTTTTTDASGHEHTLSWADFPADAYTDPADVLAAPRAEAVERSGEELLAELRGALDAVEPGLAWRQATDGGVFEQEGNGYGGRTLHRTYNSAEAASDDALTDREAAVAALEAELAERGYGAIEWEFERAPLPHETPAERDAAIVEQFGSLDPDAMRLWAGSARNGALWVSVIMHDPSRVAPGGGATSMLPGVALMAGGTVISAADEPSYRDGTAPFEGLERPDESHSS
jgi:hypothetical protein